MIRKNSCLSAESNSVAHHAEELGPQPLQLLQRRQVLQRDHHRDHLAALRTDRRRVHQRRDAAPVRHREHDLLGAHRLRAAEHLRERDLVKRDLASVGEAAGNHLQQLHRRSACRAKPLDDAARLAVKRHRVAGAGFEHRHAHRRGLDQGFQVGTGAPLGAVGARVGDRGGRLRGEQHQHLLVLGRELRRALLLGEEEVAHVRAAVAHRRALEGLRAYQLAGKAERSDKGGQVREPQRRVQVAEVFEQPRPVGPRRELAVLFRREARADEVLHLSRLVDGGDHAVAGAGERASAVNDLLQDRGQVETRVDAQERGAELA